jgi:hypothetical protein
MFMLIEKVSLAQRYTTQISKLYLATTQNNLGKQAYFRIHWSIPYNSANFVESSKHFERSRYFGDLTGALVHKAQN